MSQNKERLSSFNYGIDLKKFQNSKPLYHEVITILYQQCLPLDSSSFQMHDLKIPSYDEKKSFKIDLGKNTPHILESIISQNGITKAEISLYNNNVFLPIHQIIPDDIILLPYHLYQAKNPTNAYFSYRGSRYMPSNYQSFLCDDTLVYGNLSEKKSFFDLYYLIAFSWLKKYGKCQYTMKKDIIPLIEDFESPKNLWTHNERVKKVVDNINRLNHVGEKIKQSLATEIKAWSTAKEIFTLIKKFGLHPNPLFNERECEKYMSEHIESYMFWIKDSGLSNLIDLKKYAAPHVFSTP